MKPITLEWIDKVEGDWFSAQREVGARKHANYDAACFHAEQCAEKYLKARLQEGGIAFKKTHDLVNLLNLVLALEPAWSMLRSDLTILTDFAVDYRYPGTAATKAEAQDAVKRCLNVRIAARRGFGLPI
jgi:HEPN domain-containing protein